MAKVRGVRRLVGFKDCTHPLQIPLAASASRSQLRNSFIRFQNDVSLTVPPAAILNPEYFSLLVARLNRPTSRHVDDFSAVPRKYDMREALKAAATALRPSSSLESNTSSRATIVEQGNPFAGVSPLRTNLLGLSEGWDPALAVIMIAKPIDPTKRLPQFLLSLRGFLATTGFMVNPGAEDTARYYTGDSIGIVNTILMHWYKVPGHFGQTSGLRVKNRREVARIDARDLINKYQAYEWRTDIPLEKMCLQELGSKAKHKDGTAVENGSTVVDTFWLP